MTPIDRDSPNLIDHTIDLADQGNCAAHSLPNSYPFRPRQHAVYRFL